MRFYQKTEKVSVYMNTSININIYIYQVLQSDLVKGPILVTFSGLKMGNQKVTEEDVIHLLGGGFKYFLCLPRSLGKSSNLTSIFFKWVGSTTN